MADQHMQLGAKSNAAPPQVTSSEDVELARVAGAEDKLPLLEDIMQLARLGEIEPVKKLIEEGKFSADYKDHEGITPLHVW